MLLEPFSIMRRNVLFAKPEKGASISGRMFTIAHTAKANILVVDKYLEYATKASSRPLQLAKRQFELLFALAHTSSYVILKQK